MKRPTDCSTAVLRLLVRRRGSLSFRGVLLAILAAMLRLDAETQISRETQPRNWARQMEEVVGGAIAILIALRRKKNSCTRAVLLAWIARPTSSHAADEWQGGRSDSDGGLFAGDRRRIETLPFVPFGDQKFLERKTAQDTHINCF
jgi:hypothetical protein